MTDHEHDSSTMYKRAKRLMRAISQHPDLAKHLLIVTPDKPLGSGTRGVVYATVYPHVVVKLSEDEREPIVAERLAKLNLSHVVRVYTSFVMKVGERRVVFTYLERMEPLKKLHVEAHARFREKYSYSYHHPRTMLQALNRAIHSSRTPTGHLKYLREYRGLLAHLLDAGEWHRDLKAPNLMRDREGRLCVTDIGSFTEQPLVVTREPPLVYQDFEKAAEVAKKGGHKDVARRLLKLAETRIQPVDPRGGLGMPNPRGKTKERWLPDEMVHVPKPDGGKFRTPSKGKFTKHPVQTYPVTKQRDRMNGDPTNRKPIKPGK